MRELKLYLTNLTNKSMGLLTDTLLFKEIPTPAFLFLHFPLPLC